jgi:hypothetical protein
MTLYACDTFHMPSMCLVEIWHVLVSILHIDSATTFCVCLAGCTLCVDRRGVLSEAGETQTFHAGFTPPASILVTAADWLVQILQNVWLEEVIGLLGLEVWHVWVGCFCHHQSSSYFISFLLWAMC